MRASRLLRILLILQNRGRTTTLELANDLEVARRTVMRDIDALAEAGLPIVVHRGSSGGVELGFNYRSRLLGLSRDEAQALGVILAQRGEPLHDLDMTEAGTRAAQKLIESLPDSVRHHLLDAQSMFRFAQHRPDPADPRIPALAKAIQCSVIVRLQCKSAKPREIHPIALSYSPSGWVVIDQQDPGNPIPEPAWGDINISALPFARDG